MAKILLFTILFLGGTAHGQGLNEIAQEAHTTDSRQTPELRFLNDQNEVWSEERNYFRYLRQKDLKSFMSLWDDNFVGWPDYSDHPLKKKDIESGIVEEFRRGQTPALQILVPSPEEIKVLGKIAVTYYFWPEADETSPIKYRVMHTWQKGVQGWHIIGGMDCEVPRSAPSTPLAPATSEHQRPLTKSDDNAAVEATIRGYEEAVQQLDFARANSLLARNAKWIERSAPEAAAIGERAGFWAEAKAAKVRVRNEPHDFDIHLQGEMAWVTLLVDVTMAADNEQARELLARSETEETGKASDPAQREWRATYSESEVLVKTPKGWRIALGHTSRLPTKPN